MTKKKEPRVIIGRQTHIMSKQPRTIRNQNHHRIITSSLISEHANNDEHNNDDDSQTQPLIDKKITDKRTAVNTNYNMNHKHKENISNADVSNTKHDDLMLTHASNEHDSHDEYSILNAFDYIQAEMNEIHDFINDARVI